MQENCAIFRFSAAFALHACFPGFSLVPRAERRIACTSILQHDVPERRARVTEDMDG